MHFKNLLAFDLGAGSGRGILGKFDGKRLTIEEIHRFSNDPVVTLGHVYWDVLRLFWEMEQGIRRFSNMKVGELSSIGIDTWGVDYCLLDSSGQLLGNPFHYRDSRTEGMFEKAFSVMPKEQIYKETGISFEKFNTLFQLLPICQYNPRALEKVETLLFMPDIFTYFLTGIKSTDYTTSSTSQLMCAGKKEWSKKILEAFGIPERICPSIEMPGTLKGIVLADVADELGIDNVPVITVAGHDTASAIAAVPASGENYAFISSGTWSLMGVEVASPVINHETYKWNYSNERCLNSYCLLKNIMGMWLVQECKKEWDIHSKEQLSYLELEALAGKSTPFFALIDPNDEMFYTPGDMAEKVQKYCRLTGQNIPRTKGEIIRCIFESLAFKYRQSFFKLQELVDKPLDVLHIIGGGTKNTLLSQFTANALNRPVVCGPTEATAIGNLMVQAMALGEVADLKQIREVIRTSFDTSEYLPEEIEAWDEAYERFLAIQHHRQKNETKL